ncbi:NADP-dependent oxidoreductase [Paenibacillus cisolokensis]|nr:NADP-dependent oxidoreductase [Paenibacillus cisolokensis]
MKAAAITAFGPADALRVMEFDAPEVRAGEVRVRVKAAGVQPADTAARGGWTPPGAEIRFPLILGNEFAGIVDQVGDGVDDFAVGDEVLGFRTLGCYAEYVTVSADQIVRKPPGMAWEAAGALSASGQTAHTALQALGVGPGDTVLIHAAAGGVGSMAVQLARAWGASVIGTASEANHDYIRLLGAIPVRYGEGLADRVRALAPDGVSAALDAAGGDAVDASLALVADRSRIGTIVAYDRAEALGIQWLRSQRTAARLAELIAMHERGSLKVHIRSVYPLHRAADAHRDVESGHGRGKVVLTID